MPGHILAYDGQSAAPTVIISELADTQSTKGGGTENEGEGMFQKIMCHVKLPGRNMTLKCECVALIGNLKKAAGNR